MSQFHAAKFDEVQNFVALPESVMSPSIPQVHRMQSHQILVSISRRLGKTGLAGLQAFLATGSAKDDRL